MKASGIARPDAFMCRPLLDHHALWVGCFASSNAPRVPVMAVQLCLPAPHHCMLLCCRAARFAAKPCEHGHAVCTLVWCLDAARAQLQPQPSSTRGRLLQKLMFGARALSLSRSGMDWRCYHVSVQAQMCECVLCARHCLWVPLALYATYTAGLCVYVCGRVGAWACVCVVRMTA
jgi:hypothetical protein